MASMRSISRSLVLLLAAASLMACSAQAESAPNARGLSTTVRRVAIEASWSRFYSGVADLGKNADLVAVGDVVGIAYEGSDKQTQDIAATGFVFRPIAMNLAGSADIIVKQTGGRLGNVVQEVTDDPLMQVGSQYLLFLRRVTDGPYIGQYFVLGGPQGRFEVAEGQASSNQYMKLDTPADAEEIVARFSR